jgi:hypothetical protein
MTENLSSTIPRPMAVFDFDTVVRHITDNMASMFGITGTSTLVLPVFEEGPAYPDEVLDTPDPTVWLIMGGGPGYDTERMFDRQLIDLEVAGATSDRSGAQVLANQIDRAIQFDSPRLLPNKDGSASIRTLFITRAGGPPANAGVDSTSRSHYNCGYIAKIGTRI